MTHSLSMRKHILEVRTSEGLSVRQTAIRFHVGVASIARWIKEIEPKPTKDKPCSKIDMEKFRLDVENNPDDFQYERAHRFGVSQHAIFAALKRLGVTRKKNSVTSQSRSRKAKYILPSY